MELTPSDEQKIIVDLLTKHNVVVDSVAGAGKCHAIDTPILMYDGTIKLVQNVVVGDLLMGPDSKPRNVLSLGRGKDTMYEITQSKGETYTFNSDHILSLQYDMYHNKYDMFLNKWHVKYFNPSSFSIESLFFDSQIDGDLFLVNAQVVNISIKKYLTVPYFIQKKLKLYNSGILFHEREVPFDPYIMGLWLGDQTYSYPIIGDTDLYIQKWCILDKIDSRGPSITVSDPHIVNYLDEVLPMYSCILRRSYSGYSRLVSGYSIANFILSDNHRSNNFIDTLSSFGMIDRTSHNSTIYNKYVPDIYKINSRRIRLELLAGIIDANGTLKNGFKTYFKTYYQLIDKNEKLINDITYLARSLGFYARVEPKHDCFSGITEFLLNIYPNRASGTIPCKVKKNIQTTHSKSRVYSSFTLTKKKKDTYYGFTIDKDHRYLLGDFTVTHNTSTILFIADSYKDSSILALTYNSQLKNETRKRAARFTNLTIDSYHSFAVRNYDKTAYTDNKVNEIILSSQVPSKDICYDIIIADEAQDLTPLLYKFLTKILTDNKNRTNCKIMIMGDQMQRIYKFREADSRFITFSDRIFGKFNDFGWANCKLSQTFRSSVPIVNFINECMIGYKRLSGTKMGKYKPRYVLCNSYSEPCKLIKELLKSYKPEDIFVSAFSIKDKTPIKHLANYVTNSLRIPIYCANSDQEALDPRVTENKLVFSTIHQLKGCERKAVLFIGFDNSYFEYYDKGSDPNICPNELYVVVTRASEMLVLVHDSKKTFLPFLNVEELTRYTTFERRCAVGTNLVGNYVPNTDSFTVSELVSYLPFSIENMCMGYLNVTVINEPGEKLNVPSVVKMSDTIFESVSDITGIAIPAYFEYTLFDRTTLLTKNTVEKMITKLESGSSSTKLAMITKLKRFSKSLKNFHKEHIAGINMKELSISDLLKISLYYAAQQNRTDYKLNQITTFNWLRKDVLGEGVDRLKEVVIGRKLVFEESIERLCLSDTITLMGELDCVDKDNKIVYEFKCTKDLTTSHMIQLGIYMFICSGMKEYGGYRYRLFNIFTNELREVSGSFSELQEMIKILIDYKTSTRLEKTDDDFLQEFSEMNIGCGKSMEGREGVLNTNRGSTSTNSEENIWNESTECMFD